MPNLEQSGQPITEQKWYKNGTWPVRLVAIALLGAALLPFLPSFLTPLWLMKLLLTEEGHLFAIAALTAAGLGLYFLDRRHRRWLAVMAVAGLLWLHPLVSAASHFYHFPHLRWADLVTALPARYEVQIIPINFENQGRDLPIDLYRPSAEGRAVVGKPLIVMVHGGSWRTGNRQDLTDLNYWLAQSGYPVAAISYRLAPETTYPGQLEDVLGAVQTLREMQKEMGIRAQDLFVFGRSAGGQIAAMAGIELARKSAAVKGIVTLYAPTDLLWGYDLSRPWHVIDGHSAIGDYLGGPLSPENRVRYEAASPVYQAHGQTPPFLMIHGEEDDLVGLQHSLVMEAKLKELGRPVELVKVPWATHGFDYFVHGPGAMVARAAITQFLERWDR